MSWRDRLLPASYRGIPFYVEAHDSVVAGRRTVVHEYPGRDAPYVEDLGRAVSEWNITAYVLGRDYDVARDRLIAACGAAGEGELRHPYLGIQRAHCKACSVSERTGEGGVARFALAFVVSRPARYPAAVAAGVDTAAARTAASEALVRGWPPLSGWTRSAAASALGSIPASAGEPPRGPASAPG